MYADQCTDSMLTAIEQSNRRREKQVMYNIEHKKMPRRAQKSGTGQSLLLGPGKPEDMTAYPIYEEHYSVAADVTQKYDTDTAQGLDFKALDELIAQAKEDMERAAKELDFDSAIRHRNRMYDLQKIRDTEIGALKK
jgi:excinuclease ABC subunit B